MLQFVLLILKNLGRNKLRTSLTALAVTVMVLLCVEMRAILGTVLRRVEADGSQSRLMVTERWEMPSRIPVRYLPALARLEGVEDWTTWSSYPCYFHEARQVSQQAFGVATRPDNLVAMHAGLDKLDPATVEALKRKKSGAGMEEARLAGLEVVELDDPQALPALPIPNAATVRKLGFLSTLGPHAVRHMRRVYQLVADHQVVGETVIVAQDWWSAIASPKRSSACRWRRSTSSRCCSAVCTTRLVLRDGLRAGFPG
ncbi:MAG: hypothetical protein ACRELG_12800 [Gemmataceae bacterium]